MKYVFLIGIIICKGLCTAQTKRYYKTLFSDSPGWTKSGWVGSVGSTYALIHQKSDQPRPINSQLTSVVDPYVNPGFFAELGRFTMIPAGIVFHQMDYTVSYKTVNYRQNLIQPGSNPIAYDDKASFKGSYIGLNLNFNTILQLSDYLWLQPGLGLHVDHPLQQRVTTGLSPEASNYVYPSNQTAVRGHAKFAVGYKLTSELFIVPSLEIALWRFNELTNPRIPDRIFLQQWTPMVFAVKFLLHRPLSLKPCKIEVEEVDLTKTKRKKKKVRLF